MIAMIRRSVVCHLKKNLFRRYHKFPQTKPRLDGPALAGLDTRPGQSPHEARYLAWLGLAYFGLALAGSRPQAGPGKTLPCITPQGSDFAIWQSTSSGHANILSLLIEHGADLNGRGWDGDSPLCQASWIGKLEAASTQS